MLMQTIPFSLAAPGMALARDIKNPDSPDGPPMCGKGVVLTEALISRLQQKNVQAITVEGRPVKVDGDKSLEELLQLLDRRFRRVVQDPLMIRLKEIYRQHLIRSLGE
jgi:hypothetical protein